MKEMCWQPGEYNRSNRKGDAYLKGVSFKVQWKNCLHSVNGTLPKPTHAIVPSSYYSAFIWILTISFVISIWEPSSNIQSNFKRKSVCKATRTLPSFWAFSELEFLKHYAIFSFIVTGKNRENHVEFLLREITNSFY